MAYLKILLASFGIGLVAYLIWISAVLFTVIAPHKAIGVRVVYGVAASGRAIAVAVLSTMAAILFFAARK